MVCRRFTNTEKSVWSEQFSWKYRVSVRSAASSDNLARLWCVDTGEIKREYSGHQKAVVCLAFNDSVLGWRGGRKGANTGGHLLQRWRKSSGLFPRRPLFVSKGIMYSFLRNLKKADAYVRTFPAICCKCTTALSRKVNLRDWIAQTCVQNKIKFSTVLSMSCFLWIRTTIITLTLFFHMSLLSLICSFNIFILLFWVMAHLGRCCHTEILMVFEFCESLSSFFILMKTNWPEIPNSLLMTHENGYT